VARTVTISLPSERTDPLLGDLRSLPGVLTVHRQDGISVQPPGDVVTVEVTDRSLTGLLDLLTRYGAGRDDGVSVTTSEPDGMVSASGAEALADDIGASAFEEIEHTLDREATLGANELTVMGVSGAVAVAGLVTNSVHLVIGAMVVAPGFEPLLKLSLSAAVGGGAWRRGVAQTAQGYALLVVGALLSGLVLSASGRLPAGSAGYLQGGALVSYWRELTAAATLVAVVAGVAGALLVNANRAVLTAGVMIALGLVPGAALVGLGIAARDGTLLRDGAVRWLHDAAIVVAVGSITFGGLRARRRRRLQG
jgi:hypothetical protein